MLAVIVRRDRTVGAFATTGQWSRTDVSHAMTNYLCLAPAHPRDA